MHLLKLISHAILKISITLNKVTIVGHMIHMKLMGCMSVEKGYVEEEMRRIGVSGDRPIGSGKAARSGAQRSIGSW